MYMYLWTLPQSPDDLFETTSQALMAAMGRDSLSGYGGIVHIVYVGYEERIRTISFTFPHFEPSHFALIFSYPQHIYTQMHLYAHLYKQGAR